MLFVCGEPKLHILLAFQRYEQEKMILDCSMQV